MNHAETSNLLLNLIIVAAIILCVYLFKYFWFLPITAGPSAVDMWIQSSVDDANSLLDSIMNETDNVKLSKLENQIDVFENHYANLIPLDQLQEMVVTMYDVLQQRKEVLNAVF